MKFVFAFFLTLSVTMAAQAAPPAGAEKWNDGDIAWFTYEDGLAEAQRSNKPIFMVMHATWCGWCRKYRKLFYNDAVVQRSSDLVMVLVDVDVEHAAKSRYRQTGRYIPRTLALDKQGDLDPEIVGSRKDHIHYLDVSAPDEVLRFMREIILRHPKG